MPIVTSGFNVHPALIRPIAVGFALSGCYLLGSGFYDLFIDHDTAKLFTKGRLVLILKQSDPDRFHVQVGMRLLLGIGSMALAYGLFRLRRWQEEN